MISANKLYKQSGTSLPFSQWIEREKQKGNFIPNVNAIEEYQNANASTDENQEDATQSSSVLGNVVKVGLLLAFIVIVVKTTNK